MNKQELITQIAMETGVSQKDVQKVVEGFCNTISAALGRQDKVRLVGFGSFSVRKRKAHSGRNPRTGKPIDIPATKIPVFKAGTELKEKINIYLSE